jgi:hypothetical protein
MYTFSFHVFLIYEHEFVLNSTNPNRLMNSIQQSNANHFSWFRTLNLDAIARISMKLHVYPYTI